MMMKGMKFTDKTRSRIVKTKNYPKETMDEVVNRLLDHYHSDPDLFLTAEDVKEIEEGLADIKAGRVYTTEQLNKELGL